MGLHVRKLTTSSVLLGAGVGACVGADVVDVVGTPATSLTPLLVIMLAAVVMPCASTVFDVVVIDVMGVVAKDDGEINGEGCG